ncbi:type IV pilus twitching motility protein PilT [Geothrix alkalitolerans]|uniref:type IV pilus twitching motility protein PilT n=1 Tax=Geothrix alkalitolerans TaxID=2922724 RepID=UPI001FAE7F05|nr:PilT/PilU family type 4a pilus ATPase [Geothrix alkalitolerans]
MPQIDRLLSHVIARGGRRLHLVADQKPHLELKTGEVMDLLPNPLPALMVEVLAGEVVPGDLKASWQMEGKAQFQHELDGQIFGIRLDREGGIPVLIAEWQGPASPRPSTPPPASAASPLRTERGQGHPLAERLFSALLSKQGSDLHCTSMEPPLVRVHGDMKEIEGFDRLEPATLLEMMEALATPAAWHHFQEHHDADFAYAYEAGGCRLRVNYFMDRVGPGLVCRVIPNQLPDPDKLGLPDPVRRLCDLSKGLVLVTGPTGSGKSTTLAAIIDLANQKRHDHILTIEDPIEFVHPRKGCLVNQREVGTHTDGFKNGLRAALREDPDIILVGEMRDLETIAIALETAITGHLVFGTLHTSSAIGTIDRIVDQFPADRQQQIRVMLADALKCVVSQTLLKKIGGGRIAALETLFISPAIANLIREGKNFQIPSAMQTGRSYGQRLMNDALVELIKDKKVEPMEAYLKCPDKESFIAACKRAGIPFDLRLGEVES